MHIGCKSKSGQELALLRDCSRSLAGPTNFFLARNTQSTTSNKQTPRKTGPDQFMFAAVTGICVGKGTKMQTNVPKSRAKMLIGMPKRPSDHGPNCIGPRLMSSRRIIIMTIGMRYET